MVYGHEERPHQPTRLEGRSNARFKDAVFDRVPWPQIFSWSTEKSCHDIVIAPFFSLLFPCQCLKFNRTLPRHASSFFSPDRRIQWQMCFHGALFPAMRHTVQPVCWSSLNCREKMKLIFILGQVGDVLHLLQCLLPGMLVIAKVEKVPGEGVYKTSRGLPPAEWIDSNMEMLLDIFGPTHFRKLWRAASDKRIAFKVDIDPPELS